jgi:hypothetical protein
MNSPSDDRRHSGRQTVALDAHYDSVDMAMRGIVTSLSDSGLFVQSDFLDDPGTLVAITLTQLADYQPLTVTGRVARVDSRPSSPGMGISFTDLSEASRQRLARFIEDGHSERPGYVASAN